jgi:hypothetical protein
LNNGGQYLGVSHKKSTCGRKKIDFSQKILNMKTISIQNRQTLSATSESAAIPRTTLWRLRKSGAVRLYTANTKPILTDENKVCRVEFCKSHIGLHNY